MWFENRSVEILGLELGEKEKKKKRKNKEKDLGRSGSHWGEKHLKGDEDVREEIGASAGPEQGEKAYSILTSQRLYQTAKDIYQNLIADAQE